MNDELLARLSITTSLIKAIDLYPYTLGYSSGRPEETQNSFLRDFTIEFYQPDYPKATIRKNEFIPKQVWFLLFEESEKEILEEEFGFYGIGYTTDAVYARKRIKNAYEKLELTIATKRRPPIKQDMQNWELRKSFRDLDTLKDISIVLSKLGNKDQISLTFFFTDWPNIDELKKKEHIEAVKSKVLGMQTLTDDLPF